jgi:hypothetical protein
MALQLQVVVDRVLDAVVQQALRHAHVVGSLGGKLLGLLLGAVEKLIGRDDLGDRPASRADLASRFGS